MRQILSVPSYHPSSNTLRNLSRSASHRGSDLRACRFCSRSNSFGKLDVSVQTLLPWYMGAIIVQRAPKSSTSAWSVCPLMDMTAVTTAHDTPARILNLRRCGAADFAFEVGLSLIVLTTPWTKVLIDLWEHRGRTLVVALAIAVGVYAVGVVLNTREILVREYRQDQVGALMASAVIHTAPFEKDLADNIATLPLVAAAEGRTTVSGRVIRPDGTPQEIELVAIPDFEKLTVDAFAPLRGTFPPGRREAVVEGASFASLQTRLGDEITVELNNDAKRTLRVVGTIHDGQRFSPTLAGAATLFVTPETLETLGYPAAHTEMLIRARSQRTTRRTSCAALDQVEAQLKDSGRTIYSREVITESRADPFIGSVVLILTAFGLVILLLSSFLVVNAMSALITQQVPQIGVMKLIGARRSQIMVLYLATVLIYGLLAVVIALPLAALTARLLMSQLVEPLLNVRVLDYASPCRSYSPHRPGSACCCRWSLVWPRSSAAPASPRTRR